MFIVFLSTDKKISISSIAHNPENVYRTSKFLIFKTQSLTVFSLFWSELLVVHLGFETSRTHKFLVPFFSTISYQYEMVVRGGLWWWKTVQAGTRWQAEVFRLERDGWQKFSGWCEMAGRSFRLVRDVWLKPFFLLETGRLDGGNGERRAGCPP
jgi:hypothetical protein